MLAAGLVAIGVVDPPPAVFLRDLPDDLTLTIAKAVQRHVDEIDFCLMGPGQERQHSIGRPTSAMLSVIAFLNARKLAKLRGSTDESSCL